MYLLFSCDAYEPRGGANDLHSTYTCYEDALSSAQTLFSEGSTTEWAHIYDTDSSAIIWEYRGAGQVVFKCVADASVLLGKKIDEVYEKYNIRVSAMDGEYLRYNNEPAVRGRASVEVYNGVITKIVYVST